MALGPQSPSFHNFFNISSSCRVGGSDLNVICIDLAKAFAILDHRLLLGEVSPDWN